MLKIKRRVTGPFGLLTVLALFVVLLSGGVAQADEGGAKFVVQSQAAGLSADKASALQAKAEAYLAKLGPRAAQVAPNKIEMPGSELILAVPGEEALQSEPCPYYYFCAYSRRNFQGDLLKEKNCARLITIPWYEADGSWKNNQTRGTRARIFYLRGTHWDVPGAYSEQSSGMGWDTVRAVDPC